jgi:hypothetical protein
MDKREQLVRRLLEVAGTTYAAEAGIKVSDKPMPLFQLLVFACSRASRSMPARRCAAKLGALAPRANSRLAAALVRASLDDDVRRQVAG